MRSGALANQNAGLVLLRFASGACLLFSIVGVVFSLRGGYERLGVILTLALSAALVVLTRRNSLLFVLGFFMAYANYSALAANYFAPYNDWYMYYTGTSVAATGTFVLLIFMSVLILLFPKNVSAFGGVEFFSRCARSQYATLLAVAIAALLVVICLTQSTGFTETGGRGRANQLYEYSYIFFIVGYFYSGQSKFCRRLLDCVAVLFIVQTIFAGNRASMLAILILLYLLHIASDWPMRRQIPLLLVGFLFLQVLGFIRQDISSASFSDLASAAMSVFSRGLIWDTAAAAYHQGLVYINWLGVMGIDDRFYYASQWFISIFLGGTAVPDSQLAYVAQDLFGVLEQGGLGGGFLPFYMYFYFGLAGAVVSGVAIAAVYRAVGSLGAEMRTLPCMLAISLFITVPRWWLYSPSPLTRGLLLMFLIGGVACFFSGRQVRRRPVNVFAGPRFSLRSRVTTLTGSFGELRSGQSAGQLE
jgi:hypothetical protein